MILKAVELTCKRIGPREAQNRSSGRNSIPPRTMSSKRKDSQLAVPRGTFRCFRSSLDRAVPPLHVERNDRRRTLGQWVWASSAENRGHDVFHVEHISGFQLHGAAPICFTWNVTEPLATAASPVLFHVERLQPFASCTAGSVSRSFHEESFPLLLRPSLPGSNQ